VLRALTKAGVDPDGATAADKEAAFLRPGSLAARLTPEVGPFHDDESLHQRPRYRFTVTAD
ncbi:MAG TPA: hypothetical protein VGD01_06475, partial [Candidatus Elarobacter sp.]